MHIEGLVMGGLDLLHSTDIFEWNYSAIQSQSLHRVQTIKHPHLWITEKVIHIRLFKKSL